MTKFLLLGMGNPILSDDGVGLVLAERLQKRIRGADVAANAMIGFDLLEQVIGYDKVFIIDAMSSPDGHIGDLKIITETGGLGSLHLFSSHGLNFFDLMELGKRCGCHVPGLIAVYGIEIGKGASFGMGLTTALNERMARLEEAIIRDMQAREPLLQ